MLFLNYCNLLTHYRRFYYGEKNECAGTYKVSGYTKSDGTKVSSYMRTCGAKHEGDNNSSEKHSRSQGAGMNGGAAEIDLNLNDRVKYYNNILSADIQEKLSSEQFLKLQTIIAKNIPFPYDFLKYYRISLDIDSQKKFDKTNSYVKFRQIEDSNIKDFIQSHYKQQNIADSTDVVIVQYGTSLMNNLMNSDEFIDAINM